MPVNITIHESQFPEQVQEQLKASLRAREIQHKFHYQSYRQAEKWRAVQRAYAPMETASFSEIYESAFRMAAKDIKSAQVVGLCCGYAEKEAGLLQKFQSDAVSFLACDGSMPMVVRAGEAAARIVGPQNCQRLVCDLQNAPDLLKALPHSPAGRRLLTLFGSMHNFEPDLIFPRLAGLMQDEDLLLFSANLAPTPASETALQSILPQYDNALTFDWLFQFLSDLGFGKRDGTMQVKVESCPVDAGLQRIAIYFELTHTRSLSLEGEPFAFQPGEALRLFYSYRYTPQRIQGWLASSQLALLGQWISQAGEEGVFLCSRR